MKRPWLLILVDLGEMSSLREKEIMKNITCEIPADSKGAGCLSKELINRMLVSFMRCGCTLTDLYISPAEIEDIGEWAETPDITEEERKAITNTNNVWRLTFHKMGIVSSGKSRVIGFDFTDSGLSEDQKLFHAKTQLSGNGSEVCGIGLIDRG